MDINGSVDGVGKVECSREQAPEQLQDAPLQAERVGMGGWTSRMPPMF